MKAAGDGTPHLDRRVRRVSRAGYCGPHSTAGGREISINQPGFLKVDAPVQVAASAATDHRVRGFEIEKQITFDLCWAAVASSAARFRSINGAPAQSEMVAAYFASNLHDCPCSARPGDNGLLLWCIDCACRLIGLPCKTLPAVPRFDALCAMLDAQKPLCILRNYSSGAHYVVITGGYRTLAGGEMITIADPDRGQPDERDIAHRELLEGDGKAIAAYQL